ncbi:hypothetical protein J437_LFUL004042 [Ladona fulva]|uniref:C2H2-type domain-containing protein n=1 Tax=Ladona fulva TaxID=123851 RepID=A0A8K0JXF8_LADFU|nr:hypothetical protein J437_LFUL004042 [Ladona fulva]
MACCPSESIGKCTIKKVHHLTLLEEDTMSFATDWMKARISLCCFLAAEEYGVKEVDEGAEGVGIRVLHFGEEAVNPDPKRHWHTVGESLDHGALPTCKLCHKSFSRLWSLQRHVEDVHGKREDRTFVCNLCFRQYRTRSSLISHRSQYHGTQGRGLLLVPSQHQQVAPSPPAASGVSGGYGSSPHFRCEPCGKNLTSPQRLRRHIQNVHANPTRAPVCNICNKVYSTLNSLRNHKSIYHRAARGRGGRGGGSVVGMGVPGVEGGGGMPSPRQEGHPPPPHPVACALKGSITPCHTPVTPNTSSPPKAPAGQWPGLEVQSLHVLEAWSGRRRTPTGGREGHRGGGEGLACNVCGKVLATAATLRRHKEQQHEQPLHAAVCPVCHKVFRTINSLHNHRSVYHRQNRPRPTRHSSAAAAAAAAAAAMASAATANNNSTSPKRQFFCLLCGKMLCSKASLKRHVADKHEEKMEEFRCAVCERTYCSRNSLMTHIYTYHKSRPSGGGGAGAGGGGGPMGGPSLGSSGRFSEEILSPRASEREIKDCALPPPPANGMNEPQECPYCHRNFSCYYSLKRHFKDRHQPSDTLHRCEFCHRLYRTKNSLTTHKSLQHRGTNMLRRLWKSKQLEGMAPVLPKHLVENPREPGISSQ